MPLNKGTRPRDMQNPPSSLWMQEPPCPVPRARSQPGQRGIWHLATRAFSVPELSPSLGRVNGSLWTEQEVAWRAERRVWAALRADTPACARAKLF